MSSRLIIAKIKSLNPEFDGRAVLARVTHDGTRIESRRGFDYARSERQLSPGRRLWFGGRPMPVISHLGLSAFGDTFTVELLGRVVEVFSYMPEA